MVARETTLDKWRLIDYFDVWGNAKDGYEVNNQSIEFEEMSFHDGGDWIEFSAKEDGLPLCRLERVV